jgi:hypothetical protein
MSLSSAKLEQAIFELVLDKEKREKQAKEQLEKERA